MTSVIAASFFSTAARILAAPLKSAATSQAAFCVFGSTPMTAPVTNFTFNASA